MAKQISHLKVMMEKGDLINIGDDISISLMSTGRKVKVSIKAPIEMEIRTLRLEPRQSNYGAIKPKEEKSNEYVDD